MNRSFSVREVINLIEVNKNEHYLWLWFNSWQQTIDNLAWSQLMLSKSFVYVNIAGQFIHSIVNFYKQIMSFMIVLNNWYIWCRTKLTIQQKANDFYYVMVTVENNAVILSKLKDDCVDWKLTSNPLLKHSIHRKRTLMEEQKYCDTQFCFLKLSFLIGHKVLLLEIYYI